MASKSQQYWKKQKLMKEQQENWLKVMKIKNEMSSEESGVDEDGQDNYHHVSTHGSKRPKQLYSGEFLSLKAS